MERGSDKMSPHRDEEMKQELEGRLRSGHSTHAQEWKDPEPPADDDPALEDGPVTPVGEPGAEADDPSREALRLELARHLARTGFPADRDGLIAGLEGVHAPDQLVDTVRRLPPDRRYANAGEVVDALTERPD